MSDEEWKTFYEENPPPSGLLEIKSQISHFCDYHISLGNSVVLVTSGGTTVPLEHSTVRFVDNFSAGTRGAASAEYFLKMGYAVIFMYRPKTLEPFLREVSPAEILECSALIENEQGKHEIKIQGVVCDRLAPLIKEYKDIQEKKMLLKIQFTTLSSYLHMLFIAAQALRPMRKDVIMYLAAAVSDFYIPQKEMAIHKISSCEPLNLTLRVVPKMLQPLVHSWIPDAFIVSFKLETDQCVLLKSARKALEKYNHKLVIANELRSRKQKVIFVTNEDIKEISVTDEELNQGKEIEELIVQELNDRYLKFKCS